MRGMCGRWNALSRLKAAGSGWTEAAEGAQCDRGPGQSTSVCAAEEFLLARERGRGNLFGGEPNRVRQIGWEGPLGVKVDNKWGQKVGGRAIPFGRKGVVD